MDRGERRLHCEAPGPACRLRSTGSQRRQEGSDRRATRLSRRPQHFVPNPQKRSAAGVARHDRKLSNGVACCASAQDIFRFPRCSDDHCKARALLFHGHENLQKRPRAPFRCGAARSSSMRRWACWGVSTPHLQPHFSGVSAKSDENPMLSKGYRTAR
jgi:hypothetical protein